jgi:hypothetical protein
MKRDSCGLTISIVEAISYMSNGFLQSSLLAGFKQIAKIETRNTNSFRHSTEALVDASRVQLWEGF